ncbi:MAG: ABC transporter permease [Marmoricola sp.]
MSQEAQLELDTGPAQGPVEGVEVVEGLSPFRLAMRRFRRDKLSMAAFVVVMLYVVAAIAAPILVHFGVLDPYSYHQNLTNPNLGGLPKGGLGGMSSHHPLGVEPGSGTDVLSRLWYGITFSLLIALLATLVAVALGVVLGIVSGLSGGRTDWSIMRLVDLTLSFPQTLMLLALSATGVALLAKYLPGNEHSADVNGLYVILVLGVFGWANIARVIRGLVLSIREREFIDAARLLGASRRRLYFKEVLPNLWSPVLVYFTLTLPLFVSALAALQYLGVGVKAPTPTLGNILNDSTQWASSDFTYFFFPAVLIALIVISFNLVGDGLGDALNPKQDR